MSFTIVKLTACADTKLETARARVKRRFFKAFLFWFRQLVARYFPLNDAFFGYDIALIPAREVLNVVEIFLACSSQYHLILGQWIPFS